MVKKIFPCLVVIIAAIISVFNLANYGIPPTHDGEYHIMRFSQFYKVLSSGDFYPRWAPDFNNGFGIPLFNYVYPLPNYVASFFHVLGFGFIDSFKLNMAVASIIGAIFFYLWSRKFWGEVGGVVSSVFYTFSPYHFLDIYVRGSVGEVWSLGLVPALLWAYTSFVENRRSKFFVFSAIFLSFLIFAHNISALIFFGFFIAYATFLMFIRNVEKGKFELILHIKSLMFLIFIGFGISSPFWLPALLETKFVVGLQIFNPTAHFPVLYKLIYSSWGYGFSGTNLPDQMSFQIGIANLFAVLGAGLVLLLAKNKIISAFFISSFLAVIFLVTPFSTFVWKIFPLASYIQFPWRLLGLVILLASFLAGSLVQDLLFKKREKLKIIFAFLLILFSVFLSISYAKAPFYHKRSDSHYLTRTNFTDGTNSPGNSFNTKWISGIPPKTKSKVEFIEGKGSIKIKEIHPVLYSFNVNTKEKAKLGINTAYFPGWTVYINNKKIDIEKTDGKIQFAVSAGTSNVRVKLNNTPVQNISYAYFLISILALLLVSYKPPAIIKR